MNAETSGGMVRRNRIAATAKSNFTKEKPSGDKHHINQEFKVHITSSKTC